MSVELSPENRVYVKLNRLNRLKSPKICLSLTSNEDLRPITVSEFQAINLTDSQLSCNTCHVLKRLVCVKDIAINRLNEDRDDLKLKLTQINNKNIELTQKLKRFEIEKQISDKSVKTIDNYNQLKTKYEELEAINKHLRQHLNTLRLVFNELHNSSESTSNETTTNVTINASKSSTTSSSTQTMTKTPKTENQTENKSNSIDLNTTIDSTNESTRIGSNLGDNSKVDSLDQTLKSSFDKWYNK